MNVKKDGFENRGRETKERRKNMRLRLVGQVLAAVLVLGSLAEVKELAIGTSGSEFSLLGTDGKVHSLGEYKGKKGVAVVFTCNACPYAKAFEGRIIKLAKEYASKGIEVLAISSNDPASNPEDSFSVMVTRAKAKKYPFPYLYDSTSAVASAYGARVTPHVFLLDGNFKLVYRGRIEDESDPKKSKSFDLRNAIDALLAGKVIAVKETKAFGCSIKWRKTASTD